MEQGWGRVGVSAMNELLEKQAFRYVHCVWDGGWEASSSLHRHLQNCSLQEWDWRREAEILLPLLQNSL